MSDLKFEDDYQLIKETCLNKNDIQDIFKQYSLNNT